MKRYFVNIPWSVISKIQGATSCGINIIEIDDNERDLLFKNMSDGVISYEADGEESCSGA